ncbi:MAG: hypothetical protein ACRELA_22715 [Candidatus Rokuibacteriota bacterium]
MILKSMVRRSFQVRHAARGAAQEGLRPAHVCQDLLALFEATEGSRSATMPEPRRPALKRALLERVVREDPDADTFERWIQEEDVTTQPNPQNPTARALMTDLLLEWRIAQSLQPYREWVAGPPETA